MILNLHIYAGKHHRLIIRWIATVRAEPANVPSTRCEQAVAETKQQAFAGTVGPDDDGNSRRLKAAGEILDQAMAVNLEADISQLQGED